MGPLSALAVVALQTVTECMGCHTQWRDVPPSTFEVGLGHWTESDCYGCHREINDVAREGVVEGRTSGRFWALPVDASRREEIARRPLSFMSAPKNVGIAFGPYRRIDSMRLFAFLRQPVDMRRSATDTSRMMAYPRLTEAEAGEVLGLSDGPSSQVAGMSVGAHLTSGDSATSREGAEVFETRCKACHESRESLSGRPPEYLALFTPEWISAYANGAAVAGGAPRTMPVVPLSEASATALFGYFGERRDATARTLRARVAALDTRAVEERTAGRTLTPDESNRIWKSFLREGKCVHCHAAAEHRASSLFFASPVGLAKYVRENGGLALWRRLEVRALEAEVGMTAESSGMPMTQDPVSPDLRDLIFVWARQGCPAPSGRRECAVPTTRARSQSPARASSKSNSLTEKSK